MLGHSSSSSPNRRAFLATTLSLAAAAASGRLLRAAEPVRAGRDRAGVAGFSFYVMDTGLRGPDVATLEAKVKLVKDLGFAGYEYTYDAGQLPHLIELLDKQGLELTGIYLSPRLEEKVNERLAESIKQLKGRPTRIELAIQSKKYKPSDPAGDSDALELINRVADWAADTGPVVSIYPHTGSWAERVDDGVRLAKAARAGGRKNVGANFNLVHWKWVKQDKPIEQTLRDSLTYLLLVTINGLDDNRIVSLDQGNYDLAGFLKLLKKVGYEGRVGLQGYGVPGPSAEHLKRSMEKWRQLVKAVEGSAPVPGR